MTEQEEATTVENKKETIAIEVTPDQEAAGDEDAETKIKTLQRNEDQAASEQFTSKPILDQSSYKVSEKSQTQFSTNSVFKTRLEKPLVEEDASSGSMLPDELLDTAKILRRCSEIINEAEKLCIMLGVKAEEEKEEQVSSGVNSFEVIPVANSDYSRYEIEELEANKSHERQKL